MIIRWALRGALLLALTPVAFAQTFPFQLLVTQDQNAASIANGATLTFGSAVGQSQTAVVEALYTGSGQVTISQQANVVGSTAFKASITSALPALLTSGSNIKISIQFTPTSPAATSAQMNLPFVEVSPTGASSTGVITLSFAGTAPSFVLSYALQVDQNVVSLQPGGLIPFPATVVGASAQAALNLTNTGSGPGTISNITISGTAFRLQGKPLLPATLSANQNLTILVLYTPNAVASDTGQITIAFDTGAPVTVNLSGSGIAASFSYQLLNTSPPTTVSPGGTIPLPDTQVGQTSTVTVRILNSGNASGTVNSIGLAGQGFTVTGAPALPQSVAPNASVTFSITFAPAQPGAFSGTLLVNADTFKLTGSGLGPLLTYSYITGGTTVALGGSNNSVVFSPVAITQSEQLIFDVKNTGTLPATISNIGVGQALSPFSLTGLPALPVTIAPNADFQITIKFTPVSLGFANGTLLLDATSIALVGSGTQPPPLPSYTITGPSGNAAPRTQPAVGLTLASAYPVAISGTLTMSVAGSLPADPAVQFATGGRTVPFVIPANQTAAVFGSQGSQVGIQTGTVAGTITLTPSFATQAGNVDLTPASPASLQFAVASGAPSLIAIQFAGLTTTGFTIQVTGFATTRSLTSFEVQFATAPGFSMPTSKFTIDLKQVSTLWFQGTASQAFGGQFALSVPFTFQGSVPAGQSIVSAITSVSVVITNEVGSSNSLQAALQ